ncbi:hypothetical protein BJV82DRAFT_673244 [Fennellomyces sp. T-0311]|nr:hypothetical protein BJV82DRAFT_673244 [Fennellomyces sp. T-0311]
MNSDLYCSHNPDEIAAAEALVMLSRSPQSTRAANPPIPCILPPYAAHDTDSMYTGSTDSFSSDMSIDGPLPPIKLESSDKQSTHHRRRSASPSPAECSSSSCSGHRSGPKPRWQPKEREKLFEEIVRLRELEKMSSFDWDQISDDVFQGRRAGKACKDQWRREILPNLRRSLKK